MTTAFILWTLCAGVCFMMDSWRGAILGFLLGPIGLALTVFLVKHEDCK